MITRAGYKSSVTGNKRQLTHTHSYICADSQQGPTHTETIPTFCKNSYKRKRIYKIYTYYIYIYIFQKTPSPLYIYSQYIQTSTGNHAPHGN